MHDTASKWDGWAELLAALVERARLEHQVLGQALDDGLELLAYPVDGADQVLVGLGLAPARAERLDLGALLRQRGQRMAHCGHWLPARFDDGSVFVLRRWPQAGGQQWAGGAAQALRLAGELLDE